MLTVVFSFNFFLKMSVVVLPQQGSVITRSVFGSFSPFFITVFYIICKSLHFHFYTIKLKDKYTHVFCVSVQNKQYNTPRI